MPLGALFHVVERFVDRRQVELHAQPVQTLVLLDVGAEPVLFVLGEDGQHAGIELVATDGAGLTLDRRSEPIEASK